MSPFIVDSSVALKWIIPENGSPEALFIRERARLTAPDLLIVECVNACWKYVRRREILAEEAVLAIGVLERLDVELVSVRLLAESTIQLSIELAHPAYDCTYLALALRRGCPFVTADQKLVAKVRASANHSVASSVRSLSEAAEQLA